MKAEGDFVEIDGEKYDVLGAQEEIDLYDREKGAFVGEHTAIELHKLGDSALHATHLLKIYKNDEAVLSRIEQETLPKGLERTKQRGSFFSYHDEKPVSNMRFYSKES